MTISTETFIQVNTGTIANDGNGDTLRDAFIKVNKNFANIENVGFDAANIFVTGSIEAIKDITADKFFGDGGGLTNVTAITGNITYNDVSIIGYGTAGESGNGTINLVPDSSLFSNDQYLIVDPTVGPPATPQHIHLRAGGPANLSDADLYLGGEINFIRVSDTNSNVTVSVNNGTNDTVQWTFLSGFGPQLICPPGAVISTYEVFSSNGAFINLDTMGANVLTMGTSGATNVVIQTDGLVNSYEWIFDSSGKLKIANDLDIGNGAIINKISNESNVFTSSKTLNFDYGGDSLVYLNITSNLTIAYSSTIIAGRQIDVTVKNTSGVQRYVNLPNANTNKASSSVLIANNTWARFVFTSFGADNGNVVVSVNSD